MPLRLLKAASQKVAAQQRAASSGGPPAPAPSRPMPPAPAPLKPDVLPPGTETGQKKPGMGAFLRAHGGKIAIGAGALVLLFAVFGGGRRAAPLGRTNRAELDDDDDDDDE